MTKVIGSKDEILCILNIKIVRIMKNIFIIAILSLMARMVCAQPVYDRNSLTLMFLKFNDPHSTEVSARFKNLAVPDKFYNNPLNNPVTDVSNTMRPVIAELPYLMQYMPDDFITGKLTNGKVAQQILDVWFNRQADGSMNVEILKQRGLYNADDNDFMMASSAKRGESALMDMGLKLVNQSYVLVIDLDQLITMEEFYNENETESKDRISNGYKAKVKSYLYKLDFSEPVAAHFFNNYWAGMSDPNKISKRDAFYDQDYLWTPVGRQYVESDITQYNPGQALAPKVQKTKEELMDQLLNDVMEKITPQIEARDESFRVKAMVSDVHPISAKIGKKEGLGFDQRYYVYENQMKKDGKVRKKLVGAVKSMKVTDNRQVTEGHTDVSQFYQISGGRVDNMGMFLEQKNDVGLNMYLGATIQGMRGYGGRLEYFISKFLGSVIPAGKSGKAFTSIKVYVEGAYDSRYYEFRDQEKFTFTRISLGAAKDIYLMKSVYLEPFAGYGIETCKNSFEGQDIEIETDFAEFGARLGLHLGPKTQLVGTYQYNAIITSKWEEKATGLTGEYFYKDNFEDRVKPSVSVGLSYMF